jgi:hypothetical protein
MKVSGRDKKALMIGGAGLVLFCLIQFLVFPMLDKRSRLLKSIASKERQLEEMHALADQFERLGVKKNNLLQVLENRNPEFSLFSFLEQNAAASEVKDNINYMRPSNLEESKLFKQSLVDMKLNGISITQLVLFLEKTESKENLVGVNRLSIQSNSKQDDLLDVNLQIVSIDGVIN